MRKLYILILLSLFSINVHSQWVTIPDANFATWLNQNYPSCMNGNLMDTTCTDILNVDTIYCTGQSISDLTGIQYFENLVTLYCYSNQLTSLPTLPNSLLALICFGNQLITISSLPTSLKELYCGSNAQLTSISSLPPNLFVLGCEWTALTTLPALPNSLRWIVAHDSQLSSLPELPDTLLVFEIQNNPNLKCLPRLKKIVNFNYTNTGIECLPNYGNISSGYPNQYTKPICDIYNTNGCEVYWNIAGSTFLDTNINCQKDTTEQKFTNFKVNLYKDSLLVQQVYTDISGNYYFDTNIDTFIYTVDTTDMPIYITCPSSGFHTSFLSPSDSINYNMDFAMECKPGFDVGVQSTLRTSGQFFPGNIATIKIGAGDMASFYGLTCASGVSGNVTINLSGPVSYIGEVTGSLIPNISGTTLTYSIADFGSVNFNTDFNFIVHTNTSAQVNDQICFDVVVSPIIGDNDTTNNTLQHCFTVVNSYDPNAKEVSPIGNISPDQEWLTYTIHFQNTGNAPAQNIYVLDTLNHNLIHSSFTLLSYSHDLFTQILGNVVKFNFPNINLPDSTNDEPNSHGFVQYKIKVTPGLPIGTIISNTAHNFFDYNPPIATNSTHSEIVLIISVENINQIFNLSIFPNPTKEELNISFKLESNKEIKLDLYNTLGQIVKTISKGKLSSGKNEINLSISDLAKGIYHLKFAAGDEVVVKRVVKM